MSELKPAAAFGALRLVLLGLIVASTFEAGAASPIFDTGISGATQHKPQSKLWYDHDAWWAWLPTRSGSTVLRRTDDGWKPVESLAEPLRNVTGFADVWSDDDGTAVVTVEPHALTVVRLRYSATARTYRLAGSPERCPLEPVADDKLSTECATIARDGSGRYWIAYDRGDRIWTRTLAADDGAKLSEPIEIGGPVATDDICTIATLPGMVGVVWSDQRGDAVRFRTHDDAARPDRWNEAEVVAQGGRIADDHLHTAVAADGTLYVAAKNSVDVVGRPQFALHIRKADGTWQTRDYALRTKSVQPSRPIILLDDKPGRLHLLHTMYMSPDSHRSAFIALATCTVQQVDASLEADELLSAKVSLNNVTGCKQRLPANALWIVLASDSNGNVYEAEIPRP